MAAQTLILSNLPPDCDEVWLKNEVRHPERIIAVQVLKSDDPARHGITLVVEFAGDRLEADSLVARFHGTTVGGREVRLYAPIFGS